MNRIEFMAELESLLKDIPAEERDEAVQYYRDYFEDAGIENEMQIIAELGSPQKVAQTIKEGLRGKNEESSEYRETGYADTRFEYKETPANRNVYENEKKQEKTNTLIKVLLIIAIVIVGAPVILPVALAVICVVFALGVSGFAVLGSGHCGSVCCDCGNCDGGMRHHTVVGCPGTWISRMWSGNVIIRTGSGWNGIVS